MAYGPTTWSQPMGLTKPCPTSELEAQSNIQLVSYSLKLHFAHCKGVLLDILQFLSELDMFNFKTD